MLNFSHKVSYTIQKGWITVNMTQGSAKKLHNIRLVFSCLNGLNNRFLLFASYVAHLGSNPKPLGSHFGICYITLSYYKSKEMFYVELLDITLSKTIRCYNCDQEDLLYGWKTSKTQSGCNFDISFSGEWVQRSLYNVSEMHSHADEMYVTWKNKLNLEPLGSFQESTRISRTSRWIIGRELMRLLLYRKG